MSAWVAAAQASNAPAINSRNTGDRSRGMDVLVVARGVAQVSMGRTRFAQPGVFAGAKNLVMALTPPPWLRRASLHSNSLMEKHHAHILPSPFPCCWPPLPPRAPPLATPAWSLGALVGRGGGGPQPG